jgi:outer membrane protein assembly factor BamB
MKWRRNFTVVFLLILALLLGLALGRVRLSTPWQKAEDGTPALSPLLASDEVRQSKNPDEHEAPIPGDGASVVVINHVTKRLLRRDASGKEQWSIPLGDATGSVRPPYLLVDARRAYVAKDGVTAFDVTNGQQVWHADGACDRMLLSGDQLLATDHRVLVARSPANGADIFSCQVPSADEQFDPAPVKVVAGLYLVQTYVRKVRGATRAFLVDRKGNVRQHFDWLILDGIADGEDRVFLTDVELLRVADDGAVRWRSPFQNGIGLSDGKILPVPAGDLVVCSYCPVADSVVRVGRFDRTTGEEVWQVSCNALGVAHSEYRQQTSLSISRHLLTVTSDGSYGSFVEVLDLETGRQLARVVDKR